jgi:methionyl-tRNA formyltransferase
MTRIVCMGSDPIALPMLAALWRDPPVPLDWRGVFTQPDRPAGRGQHLRANPIKAWARAAGLPVRQPERCGPDDEQWLTAERVDLVLVLAYGQILKRGLLAIPPLGVLNLHASLLPAYRGPSPIQAAIARGDTRTGVSLMRIVPRLDAGPVADTEAVPIAPNAQAPAVTDALAAACVPLLRRTLPALVAGTLTFVEQDEARATYCRLISKDDAGLDFHCPARVLHDRIRALQPWPGARLPLDGGETLKIGAARPAPALAGTPGTVRRSADAIFVVCGDGALELLALQRPGGRMLPAADFLRGHPLADGQHVQSTPMRDLLRS